MQATVTHRLPSLTKKYLMAITGLVLVGFVLGHMLGNLQVYPLLGGQAGFNAYAYKLKTLPYGLLWIIRIFLLVVAVVHVWMAIVLTIQNRKARPELYEANQFVQSTYAARTMRWSGFILLAFIVFQLAHSTARVVPGKEYNETLEPVQLVEKGKPVYAAGEPVMTFDAYTMVIRGFSEWPISLFYIIAMGLLCMHLTHGVSSMFQSVGIRNKRWKKRLDRFALGYGWVVFLGFISIPISVLAGVIS